MTMNTTPLAHLTDEEFSTHLARKEDASDEDVESMTRIDRLLDERDGFTEKIVALSKQLELFVNCHGANA
jgi:hypothetical protein